MLLRLMPLALTLLLGLADAAWAGNRGKPQEYQATELTDDELAIQRARAKNRLNSFPEAEREPEETSFPWMFLGLGLTALLVATPFALRAYGQMAKEIREIEAAHQPVQPQPVRRTKPPTPAHKPQPRSTE